MTVQDWLLRARSRLAEAGIESANLESQLLIGHVFGVDRSWVIAHPTSEVNDLALESVLQRRLRGEPIAYILGWREFYGRRFRVGPGVLIPRQDTEVLLEEALKLAVMGPVLDIGTGSGCLAITIKLERPDLDVLASDVSPASLEIAERNAQDLDAEVRFVLSDLFANLDSERFECIISNPPYIAGHEELPREVAEFEPHSALFSGPTGFEFYERLAIESPDHLLPNGKLAVEVGHTQAAHVSELFQKHGWQDGYIVKDLSGIDRVIVVSNPA